MSILIFLIVLGVLVIVHEWGHFIAARILKISVERFSIGFGPKLFARYHKGTEFVISAIPLGGYVKLAGEQRSDCKGDKDEFSARPVWHRVFVICMGPLVNIVFAYACFYMIMVTAFPVMGTTIGNVMEKYPAYAAGLEVGDKVISVDGQNVQTWDDLQTRVSRSEGDEVDFRIQRDGQELAFKITPVRSEIPDIFGKTVSQAIIGIQPSDDMIFVRYGILESFGRAGHQVVGIVTMTFRALYNVFAGAMPAKDALAGPIRIFDIIAQAAKLGLPYLIFIVAVISASLGIFNLFPIPILDGGHLLFLAIEALRGKPVSPKVEEGFLKVGFGLLMCLMVFVLYNDVVAVGWVDSLKNFFEHIRH